MNTTFIHVCKAKRRQRLDRHDKSLMTAKVIDRSQCSKSKTVSSKKLCRPKNSTLDIKPLTLASVTSERVRQVWGGAPGAPPAILALEQIFAQKSCLPKSWHQF